MLFLNSKILIVKKNIIILILFLIVGYTNAQTIRGKVTDNNQETLIGANVFWLNSLSGTITDEKGEFEIRMINDTTNMLVVSFVGYRSDTIAVTDESQFIHFKLNSAGKELAAVTVSERHPGQYISSIAPIKTEIISSVELEKGACCDLAGCFNTNASVQPASTNIVTNAQELRILGLNGVYNQVLVDGFPLIQGLSYTFGISAIPGPLVDNIFVSKGSNSVLQGWESISGQINVEIVEPEKAPKFFFNAYLNSFMEKQFNAYSLVKKNHWSNLFAFHSVLPASKTDKNNDTFLDLPLLTRYEILDKFMYGNENNFGWSTQIGIRYTNEKRVGGQTFFNPSSDEDQTIAYGQTIDINQPEIWSKTAYRIDGRKRFVLFASAQYHKQQSWYGLSKYDANQSMINTTLQYEWKYKEESNVKTGISYRFFDLYENISFSENPLNHTYAGDYKKKEHIPGVFIENTLFFANDKFTWITGARLDNHSRFRVIISPRTLLKYSPTVKTSARASIGYGWRTANIFSENSKLLASQRDIVFTETLKPEEALNTGINFTQQFNLQNNLKGTFSADFYHTRFFNQIFPDYDTDVTKAYVGNFTGESVSNGAQAELVLNFFKRLDLKSAYNFLEVYRTFDDNKQILPFNPKHKLLNTLSFEPLSGKWHIDANLSWYGIQQLPETSNNPPEHRRPDQSEPYTMVNMQITYDFKKMELYAGCENIFDFRQEQPIISWQDPFDQYFDTSSAWGPTRGREVYLGLRFTLL
jgi:outer membrane receptor for ferrienterochelin and colicin